MNQDDALGLAKQVLLQLNCPRRQTLHTWGDMVYTCICLGGNTVLRTQLFWNIPLRNQGIASKKRQEQKKGSYLPKGRCIQGKRCAKGGQRFS
eukprot:1161210-Pelagomonas_calceolata.AAC.3